MYSACVFERAWFIDKQSPWCAAFTEDMLKVFEYEEVVNAGMRVEHRK